MMPHDTQRLAKVVLDIILKLAKTILEIMLKLA